MISRHIMNKQTPHFEKMCFICDIRWEVYWGNFILLNLTARFVDVLWWNYFHHDGATLHTSKDSIDLITSFFGDRIISWICATCPQFCWFPIWGFFKRQSIWLSSTNTCTSSRHRSSNQHYWREHTFQNI